MENQINNPWYGTLAVVAACVVGTIVLAGEKITDWKFMTSCALGVTAVMGGILIYENYTATPEENLIGQDANLQSEFC